MPPGKKPPPGGGERSSGEAQKVVLGPGDQLGSYEILDLIGTGGMGRVYLARDTKLKRKIALKVLSKELTEDPVLLQRWQREAETVAGLNHPNIVTLYSVEEHDKSRFFTMELVEGESLDRLIPRGGLKLERFLEVSIPLADALATAHKSGIAHRDLKPSNIMFSKDGRVKVLDFGLAKLVDEADAEMTLTSQGLVIGTLPYMSPEQVQGLEVDLRTDIFSLGVVLYELATGRKPFASKSTAGLASKIVAEEPSEIGALRRELPRHLGRIVHRCLEKKPERRYQSALDIRNELEALKKEIETGVLSAPIQHVEVRSGWRERIGTYALSTVWALLVPVLAFGGLLGKLAISGLEQQAGAQIIDRGVLAERPLFWAGTFLEQTLASVFATGPPSLSLVAGLAVVLLNLFALIARPAEQPDPDEEAWAQRYRKLYHPVVLPGLGILAVAAFLGEAGQLWWLAAFIPLVATYLYYLIRHPDDLLGGEPAPRLSYLFVSLLLVVLLLLLPFRYGRDFFDIHQPPVVELAQPLGGAELESFEKSGQITVVVDAGARVLATIQLSDQGKLMSFTEVERFEPRAQSKSLRELLSSIEASEQYDAKAIAGEWLGED